MQQEEKNTTHIMYMVTHGCDLLKINKKTKQKSKRISKQNKKSMYVYEIESCSSPISILRVCMMCFNATVCSFVFLFYTENKADLKECLVISCYLK